MKTYQELGITDWEHKYLRECAVILRNGLFRHLPNEVDFPDPGWFFNMNAFCITGDDPCGTVMCIGGYVGLRHYGNDREASHYVHTCSKNLTYLYFPDDLGYDTITPAQAADAIDRFLNGEAPWLAE